MLTYRLRLGILVHLVDRLDQFGLEDLVHRLHL